MFLVRATTMILLAASLWVNASLACAGEDRNVQAFDSNGVKVSFTVEGKGEPVVLIHGLCSSALLNWHLWGTSALLAIDRQVIAMDARGHGASDKPAKEAAYGLEMVEDVARLLDHLKIRKAHVVGYSMGGMIAVKFMVQHPDRVLSGTLGGMGWFKDGSFLQATWAWMPAKEKLLVTPSECVRAMGKLAVTEEEIKAIKAPVTIVVGEKDPVRQLYVAPLELIRKDWPIVLVKDADHLNCVAHPQFKDAISGWLKKQDK